MSDVRHDTQEDDYPVLTNNDRNWAMLCHLSALLAFIPPFVGLILGPLILWLVKGKEHPFIDEHGKEALNFQISVLIYSLVLCCTLLGIVLLPLLWLGDVIFVIIAAMKASDGESYRYPMCIRLIR